MMNMPLSYINFLYKTAIDRQTNEQEREAKAEEEIQDEMEDTL